ncbi:enolase, N-terminal domain protein, partial [Chlamydia psittaci 84-8471/1]
MCLREPPQES